MASQRRQFSREFKVEAVRLVLERKVSASQAVRDLAIHANVLRNWVREQRADPTHAFPGNGQQKPEDAEITQLKREVAPLNMERDILKKAAVHERAVPVAPSGPRCHVQHEPLRQRLGQRGHGELLLHDEDRALSSKEVPHQECGACRCVRLYRMLLQSHPEAFLSRQPEPHQL